jgi:signal transduction histidine kinase
MEYYKIIDKEKGIEISNLPQECQTCCTSSENGISVLNSCPKSGKRKKFLETEGERVFYFCSEQEHCIGSNKVFKSKINAVKDIVPMLLSHRDETKQVIALQNKRIYHNVVSLNAHNIQELYALVSDKILSQKLDQQRKIIKEAIEKDIDSTVSMFLRIAKNNLAIQTNFNVFNKLSEPFPSMNYRKQKIRRVFLAVYHVFFQDFFDKKINVTIEESEIEFFIDYESVSVSFYHLLDNATKYAIPDSTIIIRFKEQKDYCSISFVMESIEISDAEKDKLVEEGYKGIAATKMEAKGHGIGMYIVDQLLKLNKGRLVINSNLDNKKRHHGGLPYCKNEFIILLPKILNKPVRGVI